MSRSENATQTPRCVAALFAEDIRMDVNGKAILTGVISNVIADQFPVHVRVSCYAAFSGFPKLAEVEMALHGMGVGGPVLKSFPLRLDSRGPGEQLFAFTNTPLDIPEPGWLYFSLLSGGKVIGQNRLFVGSADQFQAAV